MLKAYQPKARLVVCLFATLLVFHTPTWAADMQAERSWRLLSELTPEERQRLDFSTNIPRDATVPYIPAEPYPFTPPYTPEEIGFRLMEFPHMPRWNCVQIEDSGTLTHRDRLFVY